MGFFFAVRKSLIDKHGLRFDENLQRYAYAEDLDFTYRFYQFAKSEGLKCMIFPKIIVKHNVSTEYRIPSNLLVFQIIYHRKYLSHKLFGSKKSNLACLWSDVGSLLEAFIRKSNWRSYFKAIKHSLKRTAEIKKGIFNY